MREGYPSFVCVFKDTLHQTYGKQGAVGGSTGGLQGSEKSQKILQQRLKNATPHGKKKSVSVGGARA
jgi:hypothetical protein